MGRPLGHDHKLVAAAVRILRQRQGQQHRELHQRRLQLDSDGLHLLQLAVLLPMLAVRLVHQRRQHGRADDHVLRRARNMGHARRLGRRTPLQRRRRRRPRSRQ